MQMFRTHGITKNKKLFKRSNKNTWYFEQQVLGYNYRMNDVEASLGISQLKRMNKNLLERKKIATNYFKNLSPKIKKIEVKKFVKSSYHLYPVLIEKEKVGLNRDNLLKYLKKNNIHCQLHYIPIFEHPFHSINEKKKFTDYPNTMKFYASALSLPMYFGLKSSEQKFVIEIINRRITNVNRNNNSS